MVMIKTINHFILLIDWIAQYHTLLISRIELNVC